MQSLPKEAWTDWFLFTNLTVLFEAWNTLYQINWNYLKRIYDLRMEIWQQAIIREKNIYSWLEKFSAHCEKRQNNVFRTAYKIHCASHQPLLWRHTRNLALGTLSILYWLMHNYYLYFVLQKRIGDRLSMSYYFTEGYMSTYVQGLLTSKLDTESR